MGGERTCGYCHRTKKLNSTEFQKKPDGSYAKGCKECSEKRAKQRQQKKEEHDADKENPNAIREGSGENDTDPEQLRRQFGTLSLEQFLREISALDVYSVTAIVDISSLDGESRKQRAEKLAELIWEQPELKYKFIYQSAYVHKNTPSTRFMFNCAQNKARQHKPKKSTKEGVQHRDKIPMVTFTCHGWLSVTITDGEDYALVKFRHEDSHISYCDHTMPDEIKEFVQTNLDKTPTQLWEEILQTNPCPTFTRKSVQKLWLEFESQKWKRDRDEIKSARILLEEAAKGGKSLYSVEPIPLPQEPGFTALAFSLPEILRTWGGKVREISLDSAWNTNNSNFEVFALLGEISGSGCPLGYLLIQSEPNSEPGARQRYLEYLLDHFQKKWKIKPIITLTDKEMSEINAFLAKFPHAKHQLCFWHCLRAIKTRLSILRRRPKYYDALEAKKEFDFIDTSFVPIGQDKDPLASSQYVAQKSMPRLTVFLSGTQQNKAPEPSQKPRGQMAIRLNGIVKAVLPLQPYQPREDPTPTNLDSPDHGDEDIVEVHEDIMAAEDSGDSSNNLFLQVDKSAPETDSEDGPDWMFEDDEVLSPDPDYVFCPAPHRKQILHLFTKHFCQHPIFPERRDAHLDAAEIRRQAVFEMYDFCKVRGLREVWGYLWACWYCPKMWKLWARSTSPYLSRLRTTMGVENFWRQLKHNYLHNIPRPRLDQLVWILVHRVTPTYYARMGVLEDTHRLGRSKPLTTYQAAFKKSWKRLLERPLGILSYQVNVHNWSCNCGQQKYHAHHLCKHLVHAVGQPDSRLFLTLVRRRVTPIYRHPLLVVKGSTPGEYIEPDGSITDGDDNDWSGNSQLLTGKDGGWRDLLKKTVTVRDTAQTSTAGSKRPHQEDTNSNSIQPSTPKRVRPLSDVVDLTASSPMTTEEDELPLSETGQSTTESSSAGYGSGDELEVDAYIETLTRRLSNFKRAINIIEGQIPHRNPIWIKSVAERIGRDVDHFVQDIERHEKTGKKRDTTWGEGKSKVEKRRIQNTMGYVVSQSTSSDS